MWELKFFNYIQKWKKKIYDRKIRCQIFGDKGCGPALDKYYQEEKLLYQIDLVSTIKEEACTILGKDFIGHFNGMLYAFILLVVL